MGRQAPLDEEMTLDQLDRDPFPIYRRLRAQGPVPRVKSVNRTLLTKVAHTKFVKDTPGVYSADDSNTPMKRALWAHTQMRKDGAEHRRERMAMAPAFSAKVIQNDSMPAYRNAARDYVARLPRGEVVDLFAVLSGAYAALASKFCSARRRKVTRQDDCSCALKESVRWGAAISVFSRLFRRGTELGGYLCPKVMRS